MFQFSSLFEKDTRPPIQRAMGNLQIARSKVRESLTESPYKSESSELVSDVWNCFESQVDALFLLSQKIYCGEMLVQQAVLAELSHEFKLVSDTLVNELQRFRKLHRRLNLSRAKEFKQNLHLLQTSTKNLDLMAIEKMRDAVRSFSETGLGLPELHKLIHLEAELKGQLALIAERQNRSSALEQHYPARHVLTIRNLSGSQSEIIRPILEIVEDAIAAIMAYHRAKRQAQTVDPASGS